MYPSMRKWLVSKNSHFDLKSALSHSAGAYNIKKSELITNAVNLVFKVSASVDQNKRYQNIGLYSSLNSPGTLTYKL